MNISVLCLLLSLSWLKCVEGAKILGMFPLAGKSLNILYNKLMIELANAGHEVTFISAHVPKDKVTKGTLRHIYLTGIAEIHDKLIEEFDPRNVKEESNMFASMEYMQVVQLYDEIFKIPEVHGFLNSKNETFDAVIIEDLWADCFKILSQIFECPLIAFSSIGGNNPFINSIMGNPLPSSYIPHMFKVGPFSDGMTFFHRVHNFLIYVVDYLIKNIYLFPAYNKVLQSHFLKPPKVEDIYNNISLILLGSHSSIRQNSPLLPNAIEIGGFHIDPPKKLPKDLQLFLDGAKDGAIYFSLGTYFKSKDLPTATRKMLLNVFSKLKQRIIWKFEEELPGIPDNVLIKKWLPQTDILAHPNIKLFITHGGQGSLLETVYHGIPCLMFPLVFDQFNNAYLAVQKGFAIKVSYRDETEVTFLKAIEEILNNPKYANNAKKIQNIFHDRPMKPIDTAIYWIEYIIRHNGADHLKVLGKDMPWYQFYSIDVISFLLICIFLILYCLYLTIRRLFSKQKSTGKEKIH